MTRLPRSDCGTSPSTMRCASPSTTAVLPTPGSPMSTGLFFVRRESTWTTRRISASRPMTGSSLPVARLGGEVDAVLLERLALGLRVLATSRAGRRARARAPRAATRRRRAARRAPSRSASRPFARPISRCSVETYESPSSLRECRSPTRSRRTRRARAWASRRPQPVIFGSARERRRSPRRRARRGRRRRRRAARRRCRRAGRAARAAGAPGSTCASPACAARPTAELSASVLFVVRGKLSMDVLSADGLR